MISHTSQQETWMGQMQQRRLVAERSQSAASWRGAPPTF